MIRKFQCLFLAIVLTHTTSSWAKTNAPLRKTLPYIAGISTTAGILGLWFTTSDWPQKKEPFCNDISTSYCCGINPTSIEQCDKQTTADGACSSERSLYCLEANQLDLAQQREKAWVTPLKATSAILFTTGIIITGFGAYTFFALKHFIDAFEIADLDLDLDLKQE
jgi:hypothetical protein